MVARQIGKHFPEEPVKMWNALSARAGKFKLAAAEKEREMRFFSGGVMPELSILPKNLNGGVKLLKRKVRQENSRPIQP
jgi:hypothetical protein